MNFASGFIKCRRGFAGIAGNACACMTIAARQLTIWTLEAEAGQIFRQIYYWHAGNVTLGSVIKPLKNFGI
ncbi:hypothetical protein AZ09_10460 [Acetobacter aceti 1023]|nr:hypothetical protein AZ09_10460 [Acetobacter aceti 1023]